ncbi:hypothetical protein FOZ60_006820 [Perkinsus olseni]|uniref:Cytochrome P450 n=1 Tax=Perkinsus olseni TaxID=32597 RepID=A0A7J6NMX9_PEROL|nr:hypothetical protein FOZ60_006820 [Perkinsus olseni]
MPGLLHFFEASLPRWLRGQNHPPLKLSSVIIAAAAGVIGLKVLKMIKRMFERAPFPGPGMSFVFRLALMSTEDQFKELMVLPRKFGKICCFKTPARQVLVVSDVPTYRSVMKRRPREFSAPDFENIMDGVNMAMSEGDLWKKHRRISSRPLTETNLDKLLPMICSTAQNLIRGLRESAGREGRIVWRPVRDLQLCAARVASAVYMGEDNPIISKNPLYTDEMQDEIWSLISDGFMLTLNPSCVFYHDRFFYRLVFPGVREFAQRWRRIESKILDATRRRVRDGLGRPHVCKSLPDSAGREFSEEELAHTLIMYLGGGAETTASAMSWLLSNFCLHPEIQQRARREADSIEELSVESIRSMPFIEACALETLRVSLRRLQVGISDCGD